LYRYTAEAAARAAAALNAAAAGGGGRGYYGGDEDPAQARRELQQMRNFYGDSVGRYKLRIIQFTCSLKSPGFNP
jgi:hypothetical protein